MKILVIASGNYRGHYGGGQVYVRNLVGALRNRGHSIAVCSLSCVAANSNEAVVKECEVEGVICYDVRVAAAPYDSELIELADGVQNSIKQVLHDYCPDVVHVNSWKAAFAEACAEEKVPCVITAHHGGIVCPAGALLNADDEICTVPASVADCLPCCIRQQRLGRLLGWPLYLLPQALRIWIGRLLKKLPHIYFVTPIWQLPFGISCKLKYIGLLARYGQAFIAPSEAIKKALVRNGISDEKIIVIHHGVEPWGVRPLNHGLGKRPLKFAYIGRINYVKGLHVVAEAIKLLNVPENSWELHCFGKADTMPEKRYFAELQQLIAGQPVIFHGRLSHHELKQRIADCDIVVLPSIYLEVFGLTVYEAFSLGRPVIVSECGGPQEIVRDGVDGMVIRRNDPVAFAEAMQTLIANPDEVERLASNVSLPCTLNEYAEKIEMFYRRAVSNLRS